MAKDGLITRKDLIEEQALTLGADYAKNMQKAIDANKTFVASLKDMAPLINTFRNISNQKDYIALKQQENIVTLQAITANKQLTASENALQKQAQQSSQVWREQNQAEIALIATKKKNELATEGTNRALIKERALLAETNQSIKRQAIANGALESAYKKLSAQVGIAGDKVKNIIATGKLASESQAQYNKRLQQAQAEFAKLNSRVRSADAAVGQFNRNVGNYPQQAAAGIRNLISAFGVTTGIYLFARIMKDVVAISRDFEKQNATLSAVLQVEKEAMTGLRDQAKKLGETTVKTAGQVTELQVAYARLGFSQQQIMDMTEATISGSIAMNSNLAETADLVGAVVNSFDDFSSTSAPEIIDVMSLATAKSALNFEKLQTAIPIAAGAANAVGIPFTRLVALFGKLSDAGIDASSSATALRNIFIESAAQNLSYDQVIEKIKNSTDKLTAANDEFGKRGAVSASIISANIDKVTELDEALQGAAGTSESMANKELATLDGAIKLLSSAWQGYVLIADDANGANKGLTGTLKFVADNLKTILNIVGLATAAWLAYKATIALAAIQQKILAVTLRLTKVSQVESTVATEAGTVSQVGNATATNLATTAWQRFKLALRANALALIVVALVAAIYYLNKFNTSLSETVGETKKSTDEFIKSRNAIAKNNDSVKTLSDRYDELKAKTTLTKDEQKELNEIIQTLAKTVPGAVSAVNKYGDAIAINTAKTRTFINAQNDLNKLETTKKLQENTEALKDLRKEQDYLNVSSDKSNGSLLDGIGYVVKINGVLKERNGTFGKWRDLTLEEQIIYKKRVLANEQNIADTEANIKSLKGLTAEERKAIETKKEGLQQQQANSARTIEVIDAEIAAQKELIKSLSDKTGKEGNAIKTKINALEAEKALIYSTDKADKKATTDHLKRIKDVKDAIYNLSQFRYENEIGTNQKIIDSDKSTTDQKIESLYMIEQLRQSKNEETLEKEIVNNALSKEGLDKLSKSKLAAYTRDAENRAKSILEGTISTEKLTNEEKLIYEKYFANLKNLREQSKDDKQRIIDSEVSVIQKQVDAELQAQDTGLNQALEAENTKFKAITDGQNDIAAATEEHERNLFAIKELYAKKALQVQIDAIQKLLDAQDLLPETERISAEKRAKIEKDLAKYKAQLSEIGIADFTANAAKRVELEREAVDLIKELAEGLAYALTDLTNAVFDARIQKIDDDISKSNEYYENQIELAGNDARQKDLLEKEKAKKEKELQKEKQKEIVKQAIFNKVIALAEIGLNLARTISAINLAAANLNAISFGVAGTAFAAIQIPMAIGISAAQAAAVLATPLPKYKMGRKGGPEELAVTGDGGVNEVISRPDGSSARYTPNTPTLTYLQKDDVVHKSVADYNEYMRRSFLKGFNKDRDQAKTFQGNNAPAYNDNSALITEMRLTRETIRKQKTNVTVTNKIDFGYENYRRNNINWRS